MEEPEIKGTDFVDEKITPVFVIVKSRHEIEEPAFDWYLYVVIFVAILSGYILGCVHSREVSS